MVVSSSPQVRYPDYYGIDMSSMDQFIAFRAAMALLAERGMTGIAAEACRKARAMLAGELPMANCVKDIYAPFTDDEISAKIAALLTPAGTRAEVVIVYQTIAGLHEACPGHGGDWYFSGDYPTPGGVRMVNRSLIDYCEREGIG